MLDRGLSEYAEDLGKGREADVPNESRWIKAYPEHLGLLDRKGVPLSSEKEEGQRSTIASDRLPFFTLCFAVLMRLTV